MAVAPVAVEMGPRNRRRLTNGAVSLAVAGSVVAGLLLLFNRSSGQSGALSARATAHASTARLIFGMSPQQVRRYTGKPALIQANCWVFHPGKTGMVGSVSARASFATVPYDPATTGDLKVCFEGRVFSYGLLHMFDKQNKKWTWAPWPLALSPSR